MIFAESISPDKYLTEFLKFRREHPELAWGLTQNVNASAASFFLPGYCTYCQLQPLRDNGVEVTGVFSMTPNYGACIMSRAEAVLDLCRTYGYSYAKLDAFAPAAKAWRAAGMELEYAVPFKNHYAPSMWKPEYGTPDVLYLRKQLKE
jgi:hypothetical protein